MDGSFEQVFLEEHAYVYRTLLRLGVPHRDVEDAMQEVFLAVHGKWTHIDRGLPKRPWLFAFAHRHAANYRRLRRHQRDWNAEPDRLASPDDPESATQAQEERALVLQALESLPDERRAVFVACELVGSLRSRSRARSQSLWELFIHVCARRAPSSPTQPEGSWQREEVGNERRLGRAAA